MKKILILLLVLSMVFGATACGNQKKEEPGTNVTNDDVTKENPTDGPSDDVTGEPNGEQGVYSGYDISEPANIVMYVLGDRPADMDKVLEKVNNDYLKPTLNAALEVNFLSWADYQTQYSLVLVGGDPVDLMYTSSWCFYGEEASKGAFAELSMDWIKQWMPQTFASQPAASWDQISLDGKIFAVPRNSAGFDKQLVLYREDLREKHNLSEITSWNTLKDYLYAIAKNEPTMQANAAAGEAGTLLGVYRTYLKTAAVADGYDFDFIHNNNDEAPSPEEIYYWPTSDNFKQYALEMAEFAKNNVWSKNAINNSIAITDAFMQGQSATIFNNVSTSFQIGKQMEEAGVGTYSVSDVTPETKFRVSSYAGDAIAIAANSKNQERAALVLDYLKNDKALNLLFTGGIEGEHYVLQGELRANGPAADKYPWDNCAWALRTDYLPKSADTDQRQLDFEADLETKTFSTPIDGFTFNPIPVQTELALLSSIRNEYYQSFQLGVFGDETEATVEEFRQRFNESGALATVQAEFIKQYTEFCTAKGIKY